jgi:flagellar motor protein MotB
MAQYVSPTKMTVIGRGDMEPISPNNSNENRAKNRRVEVSVDSLK